MATNQFLNSLRGNSGKEIVFEYRQDFFVPMVCHITDIKNLHIEAVDCGGRTSEDFQTVVAKMNTMRGNADILFEWDNEYLPTSNYRIHDLVQSPSCGENFCNTYRGQIQGCYS